MSSTLHLPRPPSGPHTLRCTRLTPHTAYRYIDSLFRPGADPEDQPVDTFIRPLLASESVHPVPHDDIERICAEAQAQWDKLTGADGAAGGAGGSGTKGPAKLDQALDMKRQELKSRKQAVTQVVDIASVVRLLFSPLAGRAGTRARGLTRSPPARRSRRARRRST